MSPRKRNIEEVLENAATAFFAQVPEGTATAQHKKILT